MVSFSKLVLGVLTLVVGAAAQQSYPVSVNVPAAGGAVYTLDFDLLQGGGIAGAARELCIQKAAELGVTTEAQLTEQCIPQVENIVTSILLANKIVDRREAPQKVAISLPISGVDTFNVEYDPTKSTPAQVAETFCVQRQTELRITTQEGLQTCVARVADFIAGELSARSAAQAAPLKSAPAAAAGRRMRSIQIPLGDKVGNPTLTVDIDAVTANQAAEYVCREHAAALEIRTVDDLTQRCIPPISAYIQKNLGTSSRPNISMKMSVDNAEAFEFSFNPDTPVNDVAADLCLQKAGDFGITTEQQLVEQCIPPVAAYIRSNMNRAL